MKRSPFKRQLKQTVLGIPAAALMLGAAQAQTTVGINFAGGSYAAYGYGAGAPAYYCGFPVTATAFGVAPANWYTTTNNPATASFPYGYSAVGTVIAGPASSLTVSWTSADCWGTGIGFNEMTTNGAGVLAPPPGNDEVTWGMLDNTGWSISLSGLNATFPNGYVIQGIGAGKVNTSSRINITDGGSYTAALAFSPIYTVDGSPVGLQTPTPALTSDSITISNPSRPDATAFALGGFIVTDQPVVTENPQGETNIFGGSLALSAQVIGLTNALAYQWQLNGANIPGATGATYNVSASTYANAGYYDIVATNLYGATTSAVATVSILAPTLWVWGGTVNGAWDINATANWKTNGVSTDYPDSVAVQFDDTATLSTVSNAETVSPYSLTVTNNTKNYTIGGSPIGGATGLAKSGTNGLTLTGTNTFTGNITISAGTVTIGGAGQLGAGTYAQKITNNGSLAFASSAPQILSGAVSGTGTLVQSGTGTNPLVLSIDEPLTGGIIANGGVLRVTTGNFDGQFTPSLVTINPGGTLLSDNYHALGGGTAVFINQGTWLMNYEDYKTNLIMIDGLITSGGGGDGGQLRAGYAGGGGDFTWTITNSVAGSVIDESINTISSGVTLTLNVARGAAPSDLTLNGIISNSGNLVFTGNGITTMTANNSYTGTTAINGGTLVIAGGAYVPGPGAVTVGGGGALEGTGTIEGPTTVEAGGYLTVGATNLAELYIYNSLTLDAGSTTYLKISKAGGTVAADEIYASSTAYGGTLTVSNVTSDSTALALGDTFQIFGGGGTGGFADFNLPALPAGLSWDTSQLVANGTLVVSSAASPPTFNPPGGDYVGAQTVVISSLTAGATIYYTLDGTTPTISSPSGTTPVSVSVSANTNLTITAYASAAGYSDSSVQTATYATVPTPTWIGQSGGNWSGNYNWSNNVVANGIGETADISTLTLTSDTTITLDIPATVGGLIFADQGDAYNWILADGGGGALTLNNGTNMPVIDVLNTNTTIDEVLAGTGGLIKAGAGSLTLGAEETYTGGTVVNGGTLQLGYNGGASGTLKGVLTVNSNATVITTVNNALGYSGTYWVQTINLNFGTLETTVASDNGWGTTINMTGGALVSSVANGYFSMGDGPVINVTGTNAASVISANLTVRDASPGGIVFNVTRGTAATDLAISGNLLHAGSGGITLNGNGITQLSGTNTYTGATAVSNGTALVTGSLGTGAVTVSSAAKLTGNGSIGGATTILSGGTLQPGLGGLDTSTLTITNSLTLGGTAVFVLDRTNGQTSAQVAGLTGVTYGGTLTVTNAGPAVQLGDTFTLFSTGGASGAFSTTNLPTLSGGKAWNWNPAAGTLTVVSAVNTTPTNIVSSVSGTTLSLSWPADHIGWRLLVQTNNLSAGISSNPADWGTVSGSAATNSETITINPALPTEFYLLVYP